MALCAAFAMPIGRERSYGTTYASLAGLTARFALPSAPTSSNNSASGAATAESGAAAPAAAAPAGGRPGRSGASRPSRAGRKHPRKAGWSLAGAGVAVSTPSAVPQPDRTPIAAASPLDGAPQAAAKPAVAPVDDSPEALRDAYESDPSKFPLDAKVWAEGVLLRLVGLCKARSGYIVKVAVTNRSGADFFIRELGAYSGEDLVSFRSHIRLFVEPGMTRDGYLVVAPPPGAQVKIKLKEDREKGRVLEVPVRYPF